MTKKKKQQYRIRNWREYNRALVGRGSLTLWLDSRSLETWLNTERPARRGRRRTYADIAIVCSLMMREVYHLPLRATEGLVQSVMRLLEVSLPVPHFSTLSRRARSLHVTLSKADQRQPLHLIVDSTGLKLYGEGEWKVRLHGWAKHRTWRKLHIGINAHSQQVTGAVLTNKDVVDPRVLPRLLKQIEGDLEKVYADASIEPRSFKRGNDCKAVCLTLSRSASIEPRSFKRGNPPESCQVKESPLSLQLSHVHSNVETL